MFVRSVCGTSVAFLGAVTPAASVTESAANCNCSVPVPQFDAVTVSVVPGCVPSTAITQFCAVPMLVMSDARSPDTGSFAVRVNVCVVELEGDDGFCVNDNRGAPGVPSTYLFVAVTAVAGPVFPAASATASCASWRSSVPSPQPDTVMLITVPDVVAGVMTQFCAVPALVKSPVARPLIASLKVMV